MAIDFPPKNFISTQSTIEGIQVYMPVPTTEEHRPVVAFSCPQCGGKTAFSAENGGLTCTNCDYYEPPDKAVVGKGAAQFEFKVETMERVAHGWGEARRELQCQGCGAHTSVPIDSLTHTCPFCDSNKVIQHQAPQDVLRPRFLIPFKIDQQRCHQIVTTWLGSSWMTPKVLHQAAMLDHFNGLYLPYWTFDSDLHAEWQAEVGHTKQERYFSSGEWKTRTKIVWKREAGQVVRYEDDMLIPGTDRLSRRLLEQIKQFDLQHLAPYEPKYLAGLQAQAYDVDLDTAWETARYKMRDWIKRECLKKPSTSRVRNFQMEVDFKNESWRYILLPVYVSTYLYQNKKYQVLINGENGAIVGQRPADWLKVGLVVAALLAPGIILSLIGILLPLFYVTDNNWLGCGIPLFVIGLGISIKPISDALRLDDD